MLAIRMQRLGRKGHATFRVVVQDSRRTPSSGKYVALLGSYDPHTKVSTVSKDQAEFYLNNGAQPSDRVVRLFQAEGVKLPSWVNTEKTSKTRTIRNPEKLRKNRPAEEVSPGPEAAAEEAPAEPEAEAQAEEPSKEDATEKPEAESTDDAEAEATPDEDVK